MKVVEFQLNIFSNTLYLTIFYESQLACDALDYLVEIREPQAVQIVEI